MWRGICISVVWYLNECIKCNVGKHAQLWNPEGFSLKGNSTKFTDYSALWVMSLTGSAVLRVMWRLWKALHVAFLYHCWTVWKQPKWHSRTRDITVCHYKLFLSFKSLHYPQCNVATKWHHCREAYQTTFVFSGATKDFILFCRRMHLCSPRPVKKRLNV